MNLIREALADKKEQKKTEERLKREAVETARASMMFDARLQESLVAIKMLLRDPGVKKVTCTVTDNDLANITKAYYNGKLSEFKVTIDGNVLTFETQYIEM